MVKTRRVAKAILLDEQQNFLLLTRSDNHPLLAGFYDLPGGTVQNGEEFGEAVIRETEEETGLKLQLENLRVLYTTTKLLHGRSYPTVMYLGRIRGIMPDVTISWEHKAYEWAPLERLPEVEPQFAPTYKEALDYVRQNNIIEDIDQTTELD